MTTLNFKDTDSDITKIRFHYSCSNWVEDEIDSVRNGKFHPDLKYSDIPHILALYEKPIRCWDEYTQQYCDSKYEVLIGLTRTNTLFFGIFTRTILSEEYDYDSVSNTVYRIQVDESDVISVNKFILELKSGEDEDEDSFSYSWAVVFNSLIIFIRLDQQFLDLVQYSDDSCEIYEWFDSERPWYRINTIQIPYYNRFCNFSFRRLDGSFAVKYQDFVQRGRYQNKLQTNERELTINFSMNPNGRSVDKDSIACNYSLRATIHREGKHNGDTDDEDSDDEIIDSIDESRKVKFEEPEEV